MICGISRLFTIAASLSIAFMCLLVGIDVLYRNVLGAGFSAVQDLLTVALTLYFFFSLPDSLYKDAHVRMDIIYNKAGPLMRGLADTVGAVGALIFLGSIGWGAASRIWQMMAVSSETPTIGLPLWPFAALVALGCAAAGLVVITAFPKVAADFRGER
ncbi:TRAP transporter small permease subunit [Mesorhizobium sp. 1B3]|uniref:TRAP transporter small permease subunit n=1 Tax=Mesorhizobium sp. 1B3 TaxID=3243599 RepID=UPI003D980FA7